MPSWLGTQATSPASAPPRVNQESRTSAASPEFARERVAKSTIIHRAETSSAKAENQVKSIQSSARWLGNCRWSQSQGMDAGEVSHRVRMDELCSVVPGPLCS